MRGLAIGDVTVTSIVERDGPWRRPEDMFPDYDPELGKRHIAELEPGVFDQASGKMVITYQTFVVRTPRHTILVDTCTGEDKGYAAPMDFPKAPWLEGFRAAGLRFEDIDYVFCTHLHIDHCGWNTVLRDGRWVPTFPRAKYVFHKREYAAWEEATRRGDNPPGNVWRFNCEPVVEAGQALLVDDDFALDDTVWLTPTPGHSPCHCCVNIRSRRRARGRHRRPLPPRPAMPRAAMVDDLRLGPEAGDRVAAALLRRGRRHGAPAAADPLPGPDGGPPRGATASASATASCGSAKSIVQSGPRPQALILVTFGVHHLIGWVVR